MTKFMRQLALLHNYLIRVRLPAGAGPNCVGDETRETCLHFLLRDDARRSGITHSLDEESSTGAR